MAGCKKYLDFGDPIAIFQPDMDTLPFQLCCPGTTYAIDLRYVTLNETNDQFSEMGPIRLCQLISFRSISLS